MIQKDHECLHLLDIQSTLVRYSLNTLDSLWTNGAESYRENVLDSAKTLSGLFSGYLTYILVVTSGAEMDILSRTVLTLPMFLLH